MSEDIWDEVHNSKKCIMLYAMEESFPDSTGLSRRRDRINRDTKFEHQALLRTEHEKPLEEIFACI